MYVSVYVCVCVWLVLDKRQSILLTRCMIPILCIYLTPCNNMVVYDRMVDRLNGIDSFFNIEYNVCGINSNTNDNPVISGNTSSNFRI